MQRLSDLVRMPRELTFGGPPECPTRPLCLRGLHDRLRARVRATFVALDAGGPVTRQALRTGSVDVGLLFTTDPAIDGATSSSSWTIAGLQPAENVTPLVRTEVVDRWGPTSSPPSTPSRR